MARRWCRDWDLYQRDFCDGTWVIIETDYPDEDEYGQEEGAPTYSWALGRGEDEHLAAGWGLPTLGEAKRAGEAAHAAYTRARRSD